MVIMQQHKFNFQANCEFLQERVGGEIHAPDRYYFEGCKPNPLFDS